MDTNSGASGTGCAVDVVSVTRSGRPRLRDGATGAGGVAARVGAGSTALSPLTFLPCSWGPGELLLWVLQGCGAGPALPGSPSFRSQPSRSGLKNVWVRSLPSSSGILNGSFLMLSYRFCKGGAAAQDVLGAAVLPPSYTNPHAA